MQKHPLQTLPLRRRGPALLTRSPRSSRGLLVFVAFVLARETGEERGLPAIALTMVGGIGEGPLLEFARRPSSFPNRLRDLGPCLLPLAEEDFKSSPRRGLGA